MRFALGLLSVSALLSAQPSAQQLPTVDQVIAKYVAAVGGRQAIEKVTSATATGAIAIDAFGITGSIQLSQKAPDKSLTSVDLSGIGRQREGFDGQAGWSEDPQNGLRDKSGAELADAKRAAIFPRELRFAEQYVTLAVAGREVMSGRSLIVLAGTNDGVPPARLFFDAESGLLVRQVVSRASLDGTIEVDVRFEDFRAVDGVMRAHTVRQITAQFTSVITLTDVKHNVPLDDAIFRKPR
jgi:hypothetical protein